VRGGGDVSRLEKVLLAGIAAAVLSLLLSVLPRPPQHRLATFQHKPDLELVSWQPGRDGQFVYVDGIVRNNSGRQYAYVQIEFVAYDAQGRQVDSTLDNTTSLDAHTEWRFRAIFFRSHGRDIHTVKFADLRGW